MVVVNKNIDQTGLSINYDNFFVLLLITSKEIKINRYVLTYNANMVNMSTGKLNYEIFGHRINFLIL